MNKGDIRPIEMMARRDDWHQGVSLFARQEQVGMGGTVATKVAFEPTVDWSVPEPFMKLSLHTAQQLIDELWGCGLRPSEGSGSAGSLRATEKHLADLKTIAFHSLKIKE